VTSDERRRAVGTLGGKKEQGRERMSAVTKKFEVVSCGSDEYPGDGLRLREPETKIMYGKDFFRAMGMEAQEGDEVEVTFKLISRIVTRREPVSGGANDGSKIP
jgi:hypothetical protein